MTLYSLRSDGDEYRITKFDNDLNVESSYLTSHTECQCPAGHRSTCRHRQMLPVMLDSGLVDSGGFYDFESQQVLLPSNGDADPLGNGDEYIDNPIEPQRGLPASYPKPSFVEGTVGITAEELAAQIPTYEQVIDDPVAQVIIEELSSNKPLIDHINTLIDKPHPHLPKITRRI